MIIFPPCDTGELERHLLTHPREGASRVQFAKAQTTLYNHHLCSSSNTELLPVRRCFTELASPLHPLSLPSPNGTGSTLDKGMGFHDELWFSFLLCQYLLSLPTSCMSRRLRVAFRSAQFHFSKHSQSCALGRARKFLR